jgi:hypothetical protein
LVAIYCPIKPERKTDKDYLEKIRSDLKKADNLRRSGKYEIENWTFITPRKLSSDVLSKMRNEASQIQINAIHQESTYLANLLYENKQLIKAFPELNIPDIESKLNEIITHLQGQKNQKPIYHTDIDRDHVYKPETKNNSEFDRIVAIRKNEKTDQSKSELKSIFYKSTNPVIQLNALLGILDFYDPIENSAENMIEICENGIHIAQQIGDKSLQAYFLAQKGYFISFIYSMVDMKTASSIMVDNVIGIQTITEEERQNTVRRLRHLEENYTRSFSEALELIKSINDIQMLAAVLILIGNAAGHRSSYLRKFGVVDRAEAEKKASKRALLAAKDIYRHLGDELGVVNSLFNLANQIRFLGEEKEAYELVKVAIETAKKHGDKRLLQRATWLEETLKTGKIPDYIHGERRK